MKLTEAIPTGNVFAGTFGGTLLSLFGNIFVADMVKTAILAAVGAMVSFGVSVTLKATGRWLRKGSKSGRSAPG